MAKWDSFERPNTLTREALSLEVRSGDGLLSRTRNLCLSKLIEAVRDQTRIVVLLFGLLNSQTP